MSFEMMQAVARVRRAQPQNVDAMRLCDELERLLTQESAIVAASKAGGCPTCARRREKQRDLMRRRRGSLAKATKSCS